MEANNVQGVPNDFMLNIVVHNTIMPGCLCVGCKDRRFDDARGIEQDRLKELFLRTLPSKEKSQLNKLFENTVNAIVIGKLFKTKALEDTGYKYFKSWARHEPAFGGFDKKQFSTFCEKVNESASVFDNWDTIVRNLTDIRMKEIDARRFSVRQFYLAKSLDWCLNYNEILRKKKNKFDEPLYSTNKYDQIFQNILMSGILDECDHDPKIASMIGNRLQSDMVAYCRRRYQPY